MPSIAPVVVIGCSSASLVERVLDCFPANSYALAGLLRLLDVVETTEAVSYTHLTLPTSDLV